MTEILIPSGGRVDLASGVGSQLRFDRRVTEGSARVRAQALVMSQSEALDAEARRRQLDGAFLLATRLVNEAEAAGEVTLAEVAALRAAIADRDLARILEDVQQLEEAARSRLAGALGREPVQVTVTEGDSEVVIEASISWKPRGQEIVMFCELEAGPEGATVETGAVSVS